MSFTLNTPGPQNILSTTAQSTGNWYRVHPKMAKLTFQVVQTGTSQGTSKNSPASTTIGSTTVIEASNDGVNPLGTVLGTVGITGSDVASDGFTIDAGWAFVRARVLSLAATTAGSTGSGYNLSVNVAAQWRS